MKATNLRIPYYLSITNPKKSRLGDNLRNFETIEIWANVRYTSMENKTVCGGARKYSSVMKMYHHYRKQFHETKKYQYRNVKSTKIVLFNRSMVHLTTFPICNNIFQHFLSNLITSLIIIYSYVYY